MIILFHLPPPCQKNLLICSIVSMDVLGNRNIDMWYMTVLESLALIKVDLLPIDNTLPNIQFFVQFLL
jgi:hypothetical protein